MNNNFGQIQEKEFASNSSPVCICVSVIHSPQVIKCRRDSEIQVGRLPKRLRSVPRDECPSCAWLLLRASGLRCRAPRNECHSCALFKSAHGAATGIFMSDQVSQRLVLVVEDEPIIRLDLVSSLESRDYRVVEAATAADALAAFDRSPEIRVVITDVRMPRRSANCRASTSWTSP